MNHYYTTCYLFMVRLTAHQHRIGHISSRYVTKCKLDREQKPNDTHVGMKMTCWYAYEVLAPLVPVLRHVSVAIVAARYGKQGQQGSLSYSGKPPGNVIVQSIWRVECTSIFQFHLTIEKWIRFTGLFVGAGVQDLIVFQPYTFQLPFFGSFKPKVINHSIHLRISKKGSYVEF